VALPLIPLNCHKLHWQHWCEATGLDACHTRCWFPDPSQLKDLTCANTVQTMKLAVQSRIAGALPSSYIPKYRDAPMAAGSAPSVPAFTECAPDADGSHRPDLGSVGTTSRATFKVPRSDAENATSAAGSECIEDQEPGGAQCHQPLLLCNAGRETSRLP
jgi:hypothetical protein